MPLSFGHDLIELLHIERQFRVGYLICVHLDLLTAAKQIVADCAAGKISPSEATDVLRLIQGAAKILQGAELALEKAKLIKRHSTEGLDAQEAARLADLEGENAVEATMRAWRDRVRQGGGE